MPLRPNPKRPLSLIVTPTQRDLLAIKTERLILAYDVIEDTNLACRLPRTKRGVNPSNIMCLGYDSNGDILLSEKGSDSERSDSISHTRSSIHSSKNRFGLSMVDLDVHVRRVHVREVSQSAVKLEFSVRFNPFNGALFEPLARQDSSYRTLKARSWAPATRGDVSAKSRAAQAGHRVQHDLAAITLRRLPVIPARN